jgi:hypothetical protein
VIRACEKIERVAANSGVMARLDQAIHAKMQDFSMLVDGRVKPGHDNRGSSDFFRR